MLKNQKGITLVSLVITVIVLLILATVAISITVSGDGLFPKAGKAANDWNSAVTTEKNQLDQYLPMVNNY